MTIMIFFDDDDEVDDVVDNEDDRADFDNQSLVTQPSVQEEWQELEAPNSGCTEGFW